MRVLIIGAGGREHALAWAISASPLLGALYVAPGNAGTAACATNVPIGLTDLDALVHFAVTERIDLVVPGPEGPLVAGIADRMAAAGVRCFGPSAAAAQLEGSKAFTKGVCDAAGIPTARYEQFTDRAEALSFVRRRGAPIVVKADGLAGGKGVVVAATLAEAETAVVTLLPPGLHAGSVVIEECMTGPEISLFALCDGTEAIFLGAARDHKRVGDGDVGPNTGGMGAFSPVPGFDPAASMAGIVKPALAEMARRGTPFRGVLFAGLMLTDEGAKLIEFNVRWGDPECQALLPRLRSDWLAAMLAACDGELSRFSLRWSDQSTVAVVMAARGYPSDPVLGTAITGLDQVATPTFQGTIFQGNTRQEGAVLRAEGGRVLTVVGMGADLAAARTAAYAGVHAVHWPDGFCRSDIGLGKPDAPTVAST